MTTLLVATPFLFSLLIFALGRTHRAAERLALAGAAAHLPITLLACLKLPPEQLDSPSRLVLLLTSFLYLAVVAHAQQWIPLARQIEGRSDARRVMDSRLFLTCLSAFLGSMTLVAVAREPGLVWVAVEATTLFSAPLICFHRSAESLEAMWKYLLICSVGIALALFGTMLLGHAQHLARDGAINPVWYKAAFILALAGYGTKMGLAPFHTWLPDAHSEAPAVASALLSGTLLNCAFLALIRIAAFAPAELVPFVNDLMLFFGAFSVAVAALFIIRQSDYKRLLAYSSVENMGLVLMLFALRESPCGEAYLVNLAGHSLVKVALFLVAGNILLAWGTRAIGSVKGLLATHPIQATLWLLGALMITAMPPSALFVGEYALIRQLVARPVLCLVTGISLLALFCGMMQSVLGMVMGEPEEGKQPLCVLPRGLAIAPALLLGISALLFGVLCFTFKEGCLP